MKDRFITLLGALAALYIVIAIFIHPSLSDRTEHSRPGSNDRGINGLQVLYTWLGQSGVPVMRLQRRYDHLSRIEKLPARGNLLIVPLPQVTPARKRDITRLQSWVGRGNNVLFLSASSDAVLNKAQYGSGGYEMLSRFGFRFNYKVVDQGDKKKKDKDKKSLKQVSEDLDKDIDTELVPIGNMPITRGVKSVRGKLSKLSPVEYTLVTDSGNRASLALLADRKTRTPAFWEVRYRQSRIWISRFGYLFSNAQLGDVDNARLIANIVSASLGKDGKVVFDDMYQGQTELYDEKAFYADSRLHNSLWFVFAFWVLYVVGHSNRIAPMSTERKPARVVDFIKAMANLFARRLTPAASARLLFSQFFDWVRLRYGLPTNGQPVWQLLETTERLDQLDIVELKKNYTAVENNRKVSLTGLVNRMQKIRSALS